MRSGRKPGLLFRCKEVLRFKKLRRPGGPPKKETMSEATNITPGTQFQPPIESLHRNAVVGALELKLRIARYRARVLFTTREELLDRILTRVQDIIEQLAAMPPEEDGDGVDEDLEHIGSIAHREMRKWAPERHAGGVL